MERVDSFRLSSISFQNLDEVWKTTSPQSLTFDSKQDRRRLAATRYDNPLLLGHIDALF